MRDIMKTCRSIVAKVKANVFSSISEEVKDLLTRVKKRAERWLKLVARRFELILAEEGEEESAGENSQDLGCDLFFELNK